MGLPVGATTKAKRCAGGKNEAMRWRFAPYLVGRELVTGDGKPNRFLVDFGGLSANRQLIAKLGGSFFRHLITPTNGGRNRHIRRQLVSVPPCTGRREHPRGVASKAGR